MNTCTERVFFGSMKMQVVDFDVYFAWAQFCRRKCGDDSQILLCATQTFLYLATCALSAQFLPDHPTSKLGLTEKN